MAKFDERYDNNYTNETELYFVEILEIYEKEK